jgi:UDP-2,3-diacylglucosamine pyrophosphatase LpxH
MKEMDKEYIDSMIIGNFHEKHIANAPQFSKFVNVTDKKERVKDIIF